MSGILRRTVFYDDSDGYVRPFEFNLVMTSVGPCLEPNFAILPRTTVRDAPASFDASDEMSRVHEIKPFSLDKQLLIMGEQTIGGVLMPKVGR